MPKYAEMERQQLLSALRSIPQQDSSTDDLEVLAAGLADCARAAVEACQAGLHRCQRLTGGLELEPFASTADDCLAQHIRLLQDVVRGVRSRCLADSISSGSTGAGAAAEALGRANDAAAALPLLNTAGTLGAKVNEFSTALQQAIASLQPSLDAAAAEETSSLDATTLRLRHDQGSLVEELTSLVARAGQPKATPLPAAAKAATAFHQAVHSLVYDMLMQKVRDELGQVSGSRAWTSIAADGAANLPAFNAYPQPHATAVGEYLMALPQMLEGLGGDDAAAPSAAFGGSEGAQGSEWLDMVAEGAAELYVVQLSQLQSLSAQGSAQLAADLEYFCNVVSALGVSIPPALATWQIATGWSQAEFPAAAESARSEGVDSATLDHIAAVRSIKSSSGTSI
ncbi:hypothetical protein WJX84_000821 [Apatococcus fuscideae]